MSRVKQLALGTVVAVLLSASLCAQPAYAASGGSSQSASSFNYNDMFYDYQVLVWDNVGGGWYAVGTYDTYTQAKSIERQLLMNGYEVKIVRITEFWWQRLMKRY